MEKRYKFTLVFVYDDAEEIERKMKFVKSIVGEDNVSLDDRINLEDISDDAFVPRYFDVRATFEEKDEIRFQLGLEDVYA